MRFTLSQNNVSLTAGNDVVTILSASNRRLVLCEVKIDGMDLVSTANELVLTRSTGGTTGGAALTPLAEITDAPAAAFTNFTTWSVQPALVAGSSNLVFGLNTFGGKERWFPVPPMRFEIRGAATVEQWSLRCVSGTGKISWHIVVDEL